MALTVRTAESVAHSLTRQIIGGTANSAPTANTPSVAHGITGSDDCILTIGIDGAVSGNTTITVYIWSTAMNQWLFAGANSGYYQKVFEPGSCDAVAIPEGTLFFIKSSQTLTQGQIFVDGQPYGNLGGQP